MAIGVYKNIPKNEITAQRYTSEGKAYNLDHNEELVVDMKFRGPQKDSGSEVNAQGWERDSKYYFKELSKKHPEYFSEKNTKYIDGGKSPIVDARFVKYFPEYKGHENETLIHHHIGGDGQAVAIPKSEHKGYGEIHNVERQVGITKNGQEFSEECEKYCKRNTDGIGKTAKELKIAMYKEKTQTNQTTEENKVKNNYSRNR